VIIVLPAGKLPLAMGDNVARQMSSGHSQIRVSRNDRCEYAPRLTKQCKSVLISVKRTLCSLRPLWLNKKQRNFALISV
jgi:hypothetical protein